MSFANEPQYPLISHDPIPVVPAANTPVKPRRSRWLRWVLRALLAILLVVGLLIGGYTYYHHRVAADLAAYLAELDQQEPGWRLRDLEAARATIRDGENSAPFVRDAAAEITKVREARKARDEARWRDDVGLTDFAESPDPLALAGLYQSTPPPYQLNAADVAALRKELGELSLALEKTQKLADLPNGRYPITYDRFIITTDVDHAHQTRGVVSLSIMAALVQLQDSELKPAARSCRAALNAARSIGDEPMLVSQLARRSGAQTCCSAVERLLNQGELGSDDLAALQKEFEAERSFAGLVIAMRGARAETHELLENVESGVASEDKPGSGHTWSQSLLELPLQDTFRKHHPRVLQQMTRAVEVAGLPPHQRQAPMQALATELDHEYGKSHVGIVGRWREFDAQLECLITALAVERYRREHNGEWPKSLVQLVPDQLPALPLDPADGAELGYVRLPDRVVIYSRVPQKGAAGNEVFDPDEPSEPGVGIAVHLYDVKYRRQPPTELLPPPVSDDDPR
jgi:hypothetical protein